MDEIQRKIIENAANRLNEGEHPIRAVRAATMFHIEDLARGKGVVVGYDNDTELASARASPDAWHEEFPPVEGATRFRVFFPEDSDEWDTIPPSVLGAMDAIGATKIGVFNEDHQTPGSYDRKGKLAAHFVLPEDAPVVLAVAGRAEDDEDAAGHTIA